MMALLRRMNLGQVVKTLNEAHLKMHFQFVNCASSFHELVSFKIWNICTLKINCVTTGLI